MHFMHFRYCINCINKISYKLYKYYFDTLAEVFLNFLPVKKEGTPLRYTLFRFVFADTNLLAMLFLLDSCA